MDKLPLGKGSKGTLVSALKDYLIRLGYKLNNEGFNEGIFGPKVEAAVSDFQEKNNLEETGIVDQATWNMIEKQATKTRPSPLRPSNPAYNEAKKYEGQGEKNSKFVAFMSKFWPKAGLNYKTIIGSSFAWCGLFVLAMNTQVGQKAISGAAGARNWAKYGVEIEYKKNGAPRGAVVHINHAGNCNSGKSNHVAFLDGDCTAEDMTRKGGTIPLFGGNQSNMVKRSIFSNSEICEVRWPSEKELPGKITQSLDCGGKKSAESTR